MEDNKNNAGYWKEKLNLQAHPEGGWFAETYRAQDTVRHQGLPARFPGDRSAGTAIYFLLEGNEKSWLHRLRADELWHHYTGASLVLEMILPDGSYQVSYLGPDAEQQEQFQLLVPAGSWFGAYLRTDGSTEGEKGEHQFSLVGCTTAPGFDFADWELAQKDAVLQEFPQHRELIERLTF